MCLIHSAHGSSQCWHTGLQNVLLRNCFPLLWNKYKAKKFMKTGRNIYTRPHCSFLQTDKEVLGKSSVQILVWMSQSSIQSGLRRCVTGDFKDRDK